jgi:hypothetical protein
LSDVHRKPLNGEKTHPLSSHALDMLQTLQAQGPMLRGHFNNGLRDRLEREDLVEVIHQSSPYKKDVGKEYRTADYYKITQAGIDALKASGRI